MLQAALSSCSKHSWVCVFAQFVAEGSSSQVRDRVTLWAFDESDTIASPFVTERGDCNQVQAK